MGGGAGGCAWAVPGAMQEYHDSEWGRPEHDDRRLYEFLVLEGAQAGLSWSTVLGRREGYRAAFAGFDVRAVARYGPAEIAGLATDPGIIRNRKKIESAVNNARRVLEVRSEFGSLDRYLWGLAGGRPVINRFERASDVPAETAASRGMSRDMRRRGFTFVGPVICYALMQATGMVNDHTAGCPLHGRAL